MIFRCDRVPRCFLYRSSVGLQLDQLGLNVITARVKWGWIKRETQLGGAALQKIELQMVDL